MKSPILNGGLAVLKKGHNVGWWVVVSGSKFFNINSGVCHNGEVDLKMGGKYIGN